MSPRDAAAWALAIAGVLPEETRRHALEVLGGLISPAARVAQARAEEVAACANYVEEAAAQYDRAGRRRVAAALRQLAIDMVRARNAG